MPKGPRGEKRPADVIGAAVLVGRIATGEVEDFPPATSEAVEAGRRGGHARSTNLSPEARSEIARRAAEKRWGKG